MPDKAAVFLEVSQASATDAAIVAAACLNKMATFSIHPAKPKAKQMVVLRCCCNHPRCFKALAWNSVHEALRNRRADPSACPAQENCGAATFSKHVETFYHISLDVLPEYMIVWDWHDIPGYPRMHFDATLLRRALCSQPLRVEIDGSPHFPRGLGCRKSDDCKKDAVVNSLGGPMLRLHFADELTWALDLLRFSVEPEKLVVYTQSYERCLTGRPEEDNIRGRDSLNSFGQRLFRTRA